MNASDYFDHKQSMESFPSIVEVRRDTREFHRRTIFMTNFNDISCGSRDDEQECSANAKLVSLYAKRFGKVFGKVQRSFIGLGSEKKWYSISEDSPRGIWDKIAEMMLLESC